MNKYKVSIRCFIDYDVTLEAKDSLEAFFLVNTTLYKRAETTVTSIKKQLPDSATVKFQSKRWVAQNAEPTHTSEGYTFNS